ncbi:hypothetical protein [Vibrio anguillarum]|uniref:hypothetical protein n=1 Tax=Vibrio anguillarum TaxID=55601 RepID=UPI000B5451EF|nr:hypothetical protein [Vibrio anguillarum]ASG03216.1 hypothetical protein CEJ46_04985 [Vibrio anguillarum]
MARYRETKWLSKNKKEIIYNVKPQDYHDFVIEIITNCDLKELRSFYSFLNKNEKLKHLLARTKIENPSQLCITSICAQAYSILGQRTPHENILLWVQMTLESNNERINYYIRKKNEFEKNRLLSNIDECHLILNEIEHKFGYSWWAIESRLSLIQDTEGKKQRVKYIRELISISKKRGIFYWVAQELSEKNDEKTQEHRYCDRIKENFDSLDIPKTWSDNLYFRTTRRNDTQALPTLILESFGNIIDLYRINLKMQA